jgi:hypothetical protein
VPIHVFPFLLLFKLFFPLFSLFPSFSSSFFSFSIFLFLFFFLSLKRMSSLNIHHMKTKQRKVIQIRFKPMLNTPY